MRIRAPCDKKNYFICIKKNRYNLNCHESQTLFIAPREQKEEPDDDGRSTTGTQYNKCAKPFIVFFFFQNKFCPRLRETVVARWFSLVSRALDRAAGGCKNGKALCGQKTVHLRVHAYNIISCDVIPYCHRRDDKLLLFLLLLVFVFFFLEKRQSGADAPRRYLHII